MKTMADLLTLTLADRISLVQEIGDSVVAESESAPMRDAEREEIDCRLADFAKNPEAGSSWSEVKARLLART